MPTRKRFYKDVTIQINKDHANKSTTYQIKLDGRNLRTVGGGSLFEVPSAVLASGVQAEWSQQKTHINKATMPLTNITNLCLDYDTKTKTKESLVGGLLAYLKGDTLLYRAFDSDTLAEMEEEAWAPVCHRLCEVLAIEMKNSNSFAMPDIPEASLEKVEEYLMTFDMWALLAMEQLSGALKSTILPLMLSIREITAKEAVDLSLIELDFQTKRWGKVEWHHDVEREDLYAKVAAATLIIQHSGLNDEVYELSGMERLKMVANELA